MFLRIIIIIIKGLKGRGEDSLDLCTMEDEGATILQNKSKPSSSDVASNPRRRQIKHSKVKISKSHNRQCLHSFLPYLSKTCTTPPQYTAMLQAGIK
jgi:hypothetical protein